MELMRSLAPAAAEEEEEEEGDDDSSGDDDDEDEDEFSPSPAPSSEPASPSPAPAADAAPATPVRRARASRPRPDAGALRAEACLMCLLSGLSGKSTGVCRDSVSNGERCWRCASGHSCRPVYVALVDLCHS
jgi:hypothetical protein